METLSQLGPAAPEEGWVPAPRYLLRRQRILRQLKQLPSSEVLEVGCGAGMLLQELAERGFRCTGLESSPAARELVRRIGRRTGVPVEVRAEPEAGWVGRFPLVLAFEVLEHIADDHQALRQWASWLAPGGTLLMSVPAHAKLWSAADEWAGHYRRYECAQLAEVVQAAGLVIEHIECLGFPLGNLTERMQARGIERGTHSSRMADLQANTERSGIERDHVLRFYPLMRSLPGRWLLSCAFAAQAMTSRLSWGNGFLLRARAPA